MGAQKSLSLADPIIVEASLIYNQLSSYRCDPRSSFISVPTVYVTKLGFQSSSERPKSESLFMYWTGNQLTRLKLVLYSGNDKAKTKKNSKASDISMKTE